MKALMLFIYVTNRCERHCDQCYCNKSDFDMSPEVCDKIARWISTLCQTEKVELLKTVFLGGEPLNSINVVFKIVDTVQLPYTKPHPDGMWLLFTNGDKLSDDVLYGMKHRKIFLALNPTYDSIYQVEKKMMHIAGVFRGGTLTIALNNMNMQRVPELAELALKYNFTLRINRLYDGGNDLLYIEQYRSQMHKVFDILLSAEKPMWPNWLMESTYPTWKGPKNPYSCGRWLLVIDPDGTIRSCNPDMSTVIGHIDTHNQMSDFVFPQRWSAKNLPECQNCEWITLCQGGCPYSRKLTFGTYNHKTPFCSVFKELFPRLLELTRKWESYALQRHK